MIPTERITDRWRDVTMCNMLASLFKIALDPGCLTFFIVTRPIIEGIESLLV
jgi:hypothetical protein